MCVQGRGRRRRMAGRRRRVTEDVQVHSESDRQVHTHTESRQKVETWREKIKRKKEISELDS